MAAELYDFTNLSFLNDYPIAFAMVDTAWGSILFAVVGVVAQKVRQRDIREEI
jgi:uncharacterized membrane protein